MGDIRSTGLHVGGIPWVGLVEVGPGDEDNVLGRLVLELDEERTLATNGDRGLGIGVSSDVLTLHDGGSSVPERVLDVGKSAHVGGGHEVDWSTLLHINGSAAGVGVSVSMSVRNAGSIDKGSSAQDGGGNDRLHLDDK